LPSDVLIGNNSHRRDAQTINLISILSHILSADSQHHKKTPIRVLPIEYVEHPIAFVSNPIQSDVSSSDTPTPSASLLDVTMLAVLGMTIAGAGVMKSPRKMLLRHKI